MEKYSLINTHTAHRIKIYNLRYCIIISINHGLYWMAVNWVIWWRVSRRHCIYHPKNSHYCIVTTFKHVMDGSALQIFILVVNIVKEFRIARIIKKRELLWIFGCFCLFGWNIINIYNIFRLYPIIIYNIWNAIFSW